MVRNVKGMTSALTSFLEEKGISARAIRERYQERLQNQIQEAQETEETQETENDPVVAAEEAQVPARTKSKKKNQKDDDEDDDFFPFVNHNLDKRCSECDARLPSTQWNNLCVSCQKLLQQKRTPKRKRQKLQKLPHEMTLLDDSSLNAVPSLQKLCIHSICDSINDFHQNVNLDERSIDRVCQILCKENKLNSQVLEIFLSEKLSCLRIEDATEIDCQGYQMLVNKCKNLESLEIYQCGRMDSDTFKYLVANMNNLNHCIVTGAFLLENEAFESFDGYQIGLLTLRLSHGHKITDEGIRKLSTLHALQDIQLDSFQRLTNSSLSHISKLENLERLDISNNHLIDDDGLILVLQNTKLSRLLVHGCVNVTGSFLEFANNLVELDCSMVPLTDAFCVSFFEKNNKLEYVDLSDCNLLTDDSFKEISPQNLTFLSLSHCRNISKDVLTCIVSNLLSIEHLDLSWIPIVDDDIISLLLNEVHSSFITDANPLRSVSVYGCHLLTEASIKPLWDAIGEKKVTVDQIVKIIGSPAETNYLINKSL